MIEAQPLPSLREDIRITVHRQRDELWYAVENQKTKKFVRLGRREYLLASAMDGNRDVSQVIAAAQEIGPEYEFESSEVLQLAGWLSSSGILVMPGASPTANPAVAMNRSKFVLNPIYSQIPLIQGRPLERVAGRLQGLISQPMLILVAVISIIAAVRVVGNWDRYTSILGKLFVADAQLWWLAAWFLLKAAHELGHAIVAVRIGSQIRSAGISLIFLAPVPYVDISDLWAVSNRWHRMLCCAGGMLVEVGLAAIAALIALGTDNQSLQYFCCAVASMGTVTTLAFNANPLLRFDGYFIVSDFLDRPNLWTDGQLAVKNFVNKLLHPWKPLRTRLNIALLLYGLACYQYRIVMLLTLAISSILVWQGVGLIIVVWGIYATIASPWLRARAASSAQKAASGAPKVVVWRDWGWNVALASGITALVACAPSPIQPSSPGVVVLREPITVRAETEGFLQSVALSPDSQVNEGDLIAILLNPQLALDRSLKQLEIESTREAMRSKRSQGKLAGLQAEESKLQALEIQLAQLESKISHLEVRAPRAGRLVQFDLHRQVGRFLKSGSALCTIAQPNEFEVRASAGQLEVEKLRVAVGQSVLVIEPNHQRMIGTLDKVDPRGSQQLSEPSLAANYGGTVPVEVVQKDGEETLQLTSPRFDVTIALPQDANASGLVPGQLVWVRLPGPSTSMIHALRHWCDSRWQRIQQDSKQSRG